MEELIKQITEKCEYIIAEIQKPTKAAQARVRKATIDLEKLGKQYRKESLK